MIECNNAGEWLSTLKSRYDIANTTLNDSTDAFTVIMSNTPNKTTLIARFCRVRQFGVVLCRRKRNITPNYEKRGQNEYK